MIRAVKVSVCFDKNYITTYNFNTDEIFQSSHKRVRFTLPQIEATQTYVPPEIRSFVLIPKHQYNTFEEMVHHSILENAETFGRNCIHIIEDYMKSYAINYIPKYSIEFDEYDIVE